MIDHAVMNPESATEERGARGETGRIRNMAAIKLHAVCRHAVDTRAGCPVIAIAAEMIGPQRINIEVEDAHKRGDYERNSASG